MSNEYYNPTGTPGTGANGASAPIRSEFSGIAAGFALLPALSGNGSKAVIINSGGTGMVVTTGTLYLGGNFATTGAFNTTLAQGASVTLTLPLVSGALATLAGTETLSNKTLVGPALGTPVSGILTNCTGTAAGLTAGSVTTNANLTGVITSVGNATSVGAQTGTGSTFVMSAAPTITGHPTIEGVTSTGATGTGAFVFSTAPTVTTLTVSSGGAAITGNTSVSSGTFTASGGAFAASPSNANVVLSPTGTGVVTISPATAGTMNNVVIGGSTPLAGTFTTASDSGGNVRSIQQSGSDKTTSYSLLTTDVGFYVGIGSGGSIVIPNSTFSNGNPITIINKTSSTASITVNTTTGYIGGNTSSKGGGGTVTLAARGVCTIVFTSATECYITGNVT